MGRLTGGDPSLLRRINSAVVLHALRGARTPPRSPSCRRSRACPGRRSRAWSRGSSRPVWWWRPRRGGRRPARQGRPARRFRFRAEAGHLLGIEIGPHRVSALLSDLGGRVLGSAQRAGGRVRRRRRTAGAGPHRGRRSAAPGGGGAQHAAGGRGGQPRHRGGGRHRCGWARRCPAGRGCRSASGCGARSAARCWWRTTPTRPRWPSTGRARRPGRDDIVFVLAGLSPGAGSLIGGRLHRGFGGAAGEIGALHLLGREVTPETLLSTTGEPLHPAGRARGGPGVRAGPGR